MSRQKSTQAALRVFFVSAACRCLSCVRVCAHETDVTNRAWGKSRSWRQEQGALLSAPCTDVIRNPVRLYALQGKRESIEEWKLWSTKSTQALLSWYRKAASIFAVCIILLTDLVSSLKMYINSKLLRYSGSEMHCLRKLGLLSQKDL